VKLFKNITLSIPLLVFGIITALMIFYWEKDLPIDYLKSKYAYEDSHFVELEGSNVHYRDAGNKQDTLPLILIHGTGASLHAWDGWTNDLKSEKRIISFDLPAYGLTGPSKGRNYTMDYYVKVLNELLIFLKIEKCIIGGNSLGGAVAWNYAGKYQSRVNKLILVDAAGYNMKSKSIPLAFKMAQIPGLNFFLKFITPKCVIENSVKNVFYDKNKVSPQLVDRFYELSLREGNRQAFVDRMTKNKVGIASTSSVIKSITIPTLIIWGKEDNLITVESAYNFARDLPNDTLVIMPRLGHTPMEEDPKATVEVVRFFLNKH
jgi:pimeloyl-ACP methyl ester carboxylesterase